MEQYCQDVVWLNLFNWLSNYIFVWAPLGWLTFRELRNKKQISFALHIHAAISAQYAHYFLKVTTLIFYISPLLKIDAETYLKKIVLLNTQSF